MGVESLKSYLNSHPANTDDLSRQEKLAVLREIVNNNLYLFETEVLGFKDLTVDLHGQIIKMLSDFSLSKMLILIPRGLFKSSVITIGYIIWRICRDPDRTFLIYSYRATKAGNFLKSIREQFQSNVLLNELYPHIIPSASEIRAKCWYTVNGYRKTIKWTDEQLVVKRSGISPASTIYTCGETTALASVHYDEIIIDDAVTEENYETLNARNATDKKIKSLFPLLNQAKPEKPSRQIFVGTRWCKDDLYERMSRTEFGESIKIGHKKNSEFQYYCRRAIEDSKAIHPSLTREKLYRIKTKEVGDFLFAASYMNDPKDAKDKAFDIEKLKYYMHLPTKIIEDRQTNGKVEVPRRINYATLIDPATGEGKCDSVVLTVGITDTEDIYVIRYRAGKYDLNETIEFIIEDDREFSPKVIAIEGFGYQRVIGKVLEDEMKRRGRKTGAILNVGNVQSSKDARIRSLQPIINRARLFVKIEHKGLIGQIDEYPAGLKDILDALSFICFNSVWCPPKADYRDVNFDSNDPLIIENLLASSNAFSKNNGMVRRPVTRSSSRINCLPRRSNLFGAR